MKRAKFYPVCVSDFWRLNCPTGTRLPDVAARATGEFRPPRKGEWYLSGAEVVAYYAPNDYAPTSSYHIAEVFTVRHVTVTRIVAKVS